MDPFSLTLAASVTASLYILAYRRKGTVATTHMSTRCLALVCHGSPADVFDAIAAIGPPYTVDDKDRDRGILVLSSRPSIWSYGFLYPVIVRTSGDGGSVVAVGVRSRLFHIGPGLGIAHHRCVTAISELLTIPPARVT